MKEQDDSGFVITNVDFAIKLLNQSNKWLRESNFENSKLKRRITILERALKKTCKALIKDDGSMVMRFMDGKQIHNSNEAEHYFIDQAEKEFEQ